MTTLNGSGTDSDECRRIAALVRDRYGIAPTTCTDLRIPVNDVFRIESDAGTFAFKLYNVKSRAYPTLMWEMDLLQRLIAQDAPIAAPLYGVGGLVQRLHVNGEDRVGVLFEWAPGEKPTPSRDTYLLLGESAARIHSAADGFTTTWPRERYDAATLIDEQITRMEAVLKATGQMERMQALADRMHGYLRDPNLDTGVCHMDLTLDNVHVSDGSMTVFDFDSAAWSWRALEPHGVLRFSESYFRDWLEAYRSVRSFSDTDVKTVAAFGIIAEISNTVWKLGFAASSRGEPLMQPEDLPGVIDGWLEWETRWL